MEIEHKENETDEEALERFRNAPTDPAPPIEDEENDEDDRATVLEVPKVIIKK